MDSSRAFGLSIWLPGGAWEAKQAFEIGDNRTFLLAFEVSLDVDRGEPCARFGTTSAARPN
jgi:hypothetical protein